MQNKKGYLGLIFLLVGVALMLFWFVYLWNNNWYSGSLKIPNNALNGNSSNSAAPSNQPAKGINDQLNDLRKDVKALQDKKDQEIMNELNAK